MAKFLAELLGCALPNKGTPPLFECRSPPHLGLGLSSRQRPTFCCSLTDERLLLDNRSLLRNLRRNSFQPSVLTDSLEAGLTSIVRGSFDPTRPKNTLCHEVVVKKRPGRRPTAEAGL